MNNDSLRDALWRLYNRPERPHLWENGGNLPWDDPKFSERMLREHLDESHGAASRTTVEREHIIRWFWDKLNLVPGHHVLDVTCGPGLYAVALAERGCRVTGIDFGPASIAYGRGLAAAAGVADRVTFIEQDVRQMTPAPAAYDGALLLYGQLAVFPPEEAAAILRNIAAALQPGARLLIELLNPAQVDRQNSTWWFSDNTGLWGDTPFLHFGERFWDADSQTSIERFHTLHLETGRLDVVTLCDRLYEPAQVTRLLEQAGFSAVTVYPEWEQLGLYDQQEWIAYVAER